MKEYYANLTDALKAVEDGEAWGALYFNENYTDSLVARLALGMSSSLMCRLFQSSVGLGFSQSTSQSLVGFFMLLYKNEFLFVSLVLLKLVNA